MFWFKSPRYVIIRGVFRYNIHTQTHTIMEILLAFAIVFWITIAIIIGLFGHQRSITFWGGFFASLLLSPLLGILFVIASERHPRDYSVFDTGLWF